MGRTGGSGIEGHRIGLANSIQDMLCLETGGIVGAHAGAGADETSVFQTNSISCDVLNRLFRPPSPGSRENARRRPSPQLRIGVLGPALCCSAPGGRGKTDRCATPPSISHVSVHDGSQGLIKLALPSRRIKLRTRPRRSPRALPQRRGPPQHAAVPHARAQCPYIGTPSRKLERPLCSARRHERAPRPRPRRAPHPPQH